MHERVAVQCANISNEFQLVVVKNNVLLVSWLDVSCGCVDLFGFCHMHERICCTHSLSYSDVL